MASKAFFSSSVFFHLELRKEKKPCCQQRQFSYMISHKMFIQVNRNSTALIKSLTCPRQSLLLLSVPWSAWNVKEIHLAIHSLLQICSKQLSLRAVFLVAYSSFLHWGETDSPKLILGSLWSPYSLLKNSSTRKKGVFCLIIVFQRNIFVWLKALSNTFITELTWYSNIIHFSWNGRQWAPCQKTLMDSLCFVTDLGANLTSFCWWLSLISRSRTLLDCRFNFRENSSLSLRRVSCISLCKAIADHVH